MGNPQTISSGSADHQIAAVSLDATIMVTTNGNSSPVIYAARMRFTWPAPALVKEANGSAIYVVTSVNRHWSPTNGQSGKRNAILITNTGFYIYILNQPLHSVKITPPPPPPSVPVIFCCFLRLHTSRSLPKAFHRFHLFSSLDLL